MKILFAGTPDNAATVLNGLLDSGHEVVGVLTREDSPVGRKSILTPSPVAKLASDRGLKVIKSNQLSDEAIEDIRPLGAELAVVVAYGVILKRPALDALASGWFNIHFSLLPLLRGAAPVQRAIESGLEETGISLFKIDEGLDTGPLVAQLQVTIEPEETAGELLNRMSLLAISLLNQELPKLYSGTAKLVPQVGESSHAPKVSRLDAKIDFQMPSIELEHKVRAMNPEPMAWCEFGLETLRIVKARYSRQTLSETAVGSVSKIGKQVFVQCGDNTALELLEVQPSGKSVMNAQSWLNGLREMAILK